MQQKIEINMNAALTEAAHLAEYYRNRCLLLSNEVVTLREENAELKAQLAAPSPVEASENGD